jgi:hypothetical protein
MHELVNQGVYRLNDFCQISDRFSHQRGNKIGLDGYCKYCVLD